MRAFCSRSRRKSLISDRFAPAPASALGGGIGDGVLLEAVPEEVAVEVEHDEEEREWVPLEGKRELR